VDFTIYGKHYQCCRWPRSPYSFFYFTIIYCCYRVYRYYKSSQKKIIKLVKDPTKVEKIGSADLNDIDKEIRFLFEEQEVINVVEGGEIAGRLKKETVRTCTQLG
jgi:hypothetical protein